MTIIFFFLMLPIAMIALGPFNFGLSEYIALIMAGGLGFGGLLGMLYLIEPERREHGGH